MRAPAGLVSVEEEKPPDVLPEGIFLADLAEDLVEDPEDDLDDVFVDVERPPLFLGVTVLVTVLPLYELPDSMAFRTVWMACSFFSLRTSSKSHLLFILRAMRCPP